MEPSDEFPRRDSGHPPTRSVSPEEKPSNVPYSGVPFRSGEEKTTSLPGLDVSLAESEYRERRQEQRRRQQAQPQTFLHPPNHDLLPSPPTPAFSRNGPPRHFAAAAGPPSWSPTTAPTAPPPPYSSGSAAESPTYSPSSFTMPLVPSRGQTMGGDEADPLSSPYLRPYGAESGASTGWVPQLPAPPLGPVATSRSKLRSRIRLCAFCVAPMLLLVIVAILGSVLAHQRDAASPS